MKKIIIILLAVSVLSIGLWGCRTPSVQSAGGSASELRLEFTLLDVDGNEVSLSDFQGKTVLVNFFGTWCAPCRKEMPDFVEVYEMYRDRNVEFVGIAVNSDLDAVKDFIAEFGVDFPILMDGSLENVAGKVGIRAIPSTLILDEDLNALIGFTGLLTKSQLIDILEDALKSAS